MILKAISILTLVTDITMIGLFIWSIKDSIHKGKTGSESISLIITYTLILNVISIIGGK